MFLAWLVNLIPLLGVGFGVAVFDDVSVVLLACVLNR
jgi:hypothetical protein